MSTMTSLSPLRLVMTNNDILEADHGCFGLTKRELCDLSLVCRAFREAVTPKLYADVAIESYSCLQALSRVAEERLCHIR